MTKDSESGRAILTRLSETLGLPVERFFTDKLCMEAWEGADECLRLWSEIRTEEGRQQALEALRTIAGRDEA